MTFDVVSYSTPYVSGHLVCSFVCNSRWSESLIKLPTVMLNQLPEQTSSALTMGAKLPSQQALLSMCPRCAQQE